MDIVSLIFLGLLIFGLFRPVGFLMALSMAYSAFGSLSLIPPELSGGVTLLAGSMGTLFLVIKTCTLPHSLDQMWRSATNWRILGILTAFTLVALASAIVLPRVFENFVNVFPLRRTAALAVTEPLAPSTANFTQSAYLTISFAVAIAFSQLVRRPNFVEDYARAIVIGAATLVLTGVLDVVAKSAGLSDYLSIFRTANYAFLVDAEIAGVRRVVGLMPEASSFGGTAAFYFSLLLFTRHIYAPRFWRRVVAPLTALCAVFAALSTSSSAYVALGVTAAVFILNNVRTLLLGSDLERSRASEEIAIALILLILLVFLASLFDETREIAYKLIDTTILQKSQSGSYIERSSWTSAAFEAWLATGGLGVGTGAVRTSNFFVNILASTGFLGFSLFVAFIVRTFVSPSPADRILNNLFHGCRLTLFPMMVGAAIAGTTPDYGGLIASFFGIIAGSSLLARRPVRSATAPDYTSGIAMRK